MGMKLNTALTIAGSDCSGGAGIQADIKTMMANGVYAMSVITAVTAQNTLGVSRIMEVTPELLEQQLDCVFTDIVPDAVKIGMVASGELLEVIACKLRQYNARNVVIDPVMISSSGTRLMKENAIITLQEQLFPCASLLTPNLPETEVLWGRSITTTAERIQAAEELGTRYHCAVLCKGGHQLSTEEAMANDLLYAEGNICLIAGKRVDNPNTHGTGCTLSSAIAANLAKGYELERAVRLAKQYLTGTLEAMLDLGRGSGPLNHGYAIL